MNVAQPSVTRTVQALERELATPLLQRDRRVVILTRTGVVFATETREMLARLNAATRLARRTAEGEGGRLVIGFEGSAAFSFIPRSVAAFRSRYPDIEVELHEMPSGKQLVALRQRQLDLGFVVPTVEDPAVVVEVMQREPIVVTMAAMHPLARHRAVTAAQLAEQTLILALPGDVCGSTLAVRAVLGEQAPRAAILVSDVQLRLSFVAAGEGLALIPLSLSALGQQSIAFRPLRPAVRMDVAVARLEEPAAGVAAMRFVATAREMVQETINLQTEHTSIAAARG